MAKERKWLIEFRGSRTQEEVAKAIGVHRGHYAHIEKGTRTPSVSLAKKISKALGFDWTIFFENDCVDTTNKFFTEVANEHQDRKMEWLRDPVRLAQQ